MEANKWFKLACKSTELQLKGTLNGGQSFRWKQLKSKTNQWIGVFQGKVWLLQQEPDHILYQVYEPESSNQSPETENAYNKMLKDYFHLDLNLEQHYTEWSKCDPYFAEASKQFYGIRILQQDVVENIFSFICSSNNNISRISSMVDKLGKFYGDKICTIDDDTYYTFPSVEKLAQTGVEEKLRENGFGYRSKYIHKSALFIIDQGGDKWLKQLKNEDYTGAKKQLMQLTGVGAKVADCICLMSLGHLNSIPVDTHIFQIAANLYMPHLLKNKTKTVTEKTYNEIGDHFRNLYGPLAGWAHTVLFCADLKKFKNDSLPEPPQKTRKKSQKIVIND